MKKAQIAILTLGLLFVVGFSASASAQCGKPGSQLKSNEYFTVLKNGKIKLREGFRMEKVVNEKGREFLRIVSMDKSLEAIGLDCGCPAGTATSLCAIENNGGSANCLGECRGADGSRGFCNFTFTQEAQPEAQ